VSCARLGGEWLVCGIPVTQRRSSSSMRTGAIGRSLGEAMAQCWRGQGGRGGVHVGGTGSGAAAIEARAPGQGTAAMKLLAGFVARRRGGDFDRWAHVERGWLTGGAARALGPTGSGVR
jgi:hypothetical protein